MKKLTAEHLVLYYDRNSLPALEVEQGEPFVVETHDMFERMPSSGLDWEADRQHFQRNGVTGPVYVRGAVPGAALRVELLDLAPALDYGAILTLPGRGYFASKLPPGYTKRVVPIEGQYVRFKPDIRVRLAPMLGKIGVAPAGEPVFSSTPGPHGGNIDNTMIGRGAIVYLPIAAEGGLLSIGDAHAAMGDGESAISGVETAVRATLRCTVCDSPRISNPLVVAGSRVATVASAATMEDAARIALDDMATLLCQLRGLSYLEAATLISVAGDLRVCQAVNKLVTMRVEIDSELLPIG